MKKFNVARKMYGLYGDLLIGSYFSIFLFCAAMLIIPFFVWNSAFADFMYNNGATNFYGVTNRYNAWGFSPFFILYLILSFIGIYWDFPRHIRLKENTVVSFDNGKYILESWYSSLKNLNEKKEFNYQITKDDVKSFRFLWQNGLEINYTDIENNKSKFYLYGVTRKNFIAFLNKIKK